ncbi:hypothetical protein [Alkalihalobacillus sp. 1P02AB]|uniref:hypothetical protein n=1 Tax=Alkalihalobacillus sp. 1P02AB TaxID=3132260 RepID=UPI0039A66691
MDNQFNKAKSFGEILDQTFRLSKNHFSVFFLVFLILLGPFILLEALVQLSFGASFFQAGDTGAPWYERMFSGLALDEVEGEMTNLAQDALVSIIGLISFIFYPVAQAAIIIGVFSLRSQKEFTAGTLIKKAFSRFWGILGSSILYYLIMFGIFIVPFIVILVVGIFSVVSIDNAFIGILMMILFIIGFFVAIGYLLIRWSMYLGVVVIDKEAPGIGRSWNLTRGNGWRILGLFIVITIIMLMVSTAIEFTLAFLLGYSVLTSMILSLVSLFVTMVISVAMAIIFFDLKVRNDADDLKTMIDDYKTE